MPPRRSPIRTSCRTSPAIVWHDVVIQGRTITGEMTDNHTTFQTYTPEDPTLIQKLTDKGVRVVAKPEDDGGNTLITTC